MKPHAVIVRGLIIASLAATAAAQQEPAKPPAPKPAAPKAAAKVTVPPAIEAAFKKAYPNATIRHVDKERVDGKEGYEVESLDNGQARDLIYRADGTLVRYEEKVAERDLPPAVVAAIKTRYPKATFAVCEKLFENGTMNYEVELKGAKVDEVVVSPEGKFLSPK